MKISLVLIDIVLIISIALPYYWFIKLGLKQAKENNNKFQTLLSMNNLSLGVQEIWSNTLIGIDPVKNSLIFIKLVNPDNVFKIIDLSTVKNCELKEVVKHINSGSSREKILDRLDIELTIFGSEETKILLTFYDLKDIYKEEFETLRGEKWIKLINHYIHNQKAKKLVA